MYHITKGRDNMRKTPEIPELLQEYIEMMHPDSRLLFLKKEIPDALIGVLMDYQVKYNQEWKEHLDKKLCLMPIEDKWRYERVPVPEELKKYVIGGGCGLTATIDFRLTPPWLWRKLFKFKKAEKELNKKKREIKEDMLKQYYDNIKAQ